MRAEFDFWRGRLNLSLISIYHSHWSVNIAPWVFHPCAGTVLCHCISCLYLFLSWLQTGNLSPETCNTIHLCLMAWLICSWIVYTVHVYFLLYSSSFATVRNILVLNCWMDSVEFLGKKCTAFPSSLISYALKFIPRWHIGKTKLRSSVRALMESFGTKCCKASLLMLPPCKHTPANPELTCTEKQAYVGQGDWKDKLWKQLSAIKSVESSMRTHWQIREYSLYELMI